MKYLHTMVRVTDIDASLDFYCTQLGLVELRRHENRVCRPEKFVVEPLRRPCRA
jgi:lactoylglutathione lyase